MHYSVRSLHASGTLSSRTAEVNVAPAQGQLSRSVPPLAPLAFRPFPLSSLGLLQFYSLLVSELPTAVVLYTDLPLRDAVTQPRASFLPPAAALARLLAAMPRSFLFIDYESASDSSLGGLKLPASISYEVSAPACCWPPARTAEPLLSLSLQACEHEVRKHWKLPELDFAVLFTQLDARRGKSYTISSAAWQWQEGEDVDLALVVVPRATPTTQRAKDEPATPARSTTPIYAPRSPLRLPRQPHSTTPAPPDADSAPHTAPNPSHEHGLVVPATPSVTDDSGDEGSAPPSLGDEGSRRGSARKKRKQERTESREKLADAADARVPLPLQSSSSGSGSAPSQPHASTSTSTSSSLLPASSSQSQPQASHPPAQQEPPSQPSSLSQSTTSRRSDAPSPIGAHAPILKSSHGSSSDEMRWGKQPQPQSQQQSSPRRSSVGSEFAVGLVDGEVAFVRRSPGKDKRRVEEGEGEGEMSVDQEEQEEERGAASARIKLEAQSPGDVFSQSHATASNSTSNSSSAASSNNRALKHHSSGSQAQGPSALAGGVTPAEARRALLAIGAVDPSLLTRGVKRKDPPTPRRAGEGEGQGQKRPRVSGGSGSVSGSVSGGRVGSLPFPAAAAVEENQSPQRPRATQYRRASVLCSPSSATASRPRPPSTADALGLTTSTFEKPSPRKPAPALRRSLPETPASSQLDLGSLTQSQSHGTPTTSRRSSRWHANIHLPPSPISPRQAA